MLESAYLFTQKMDIFVQNNSEDKWVWQKVFFSIYFDAPGVIDEFGLK